MLSKKIFPRLEAIPIPFYLYDMKLLERTLAAAVRESCRYGYKIHYTLKANFEKKILEKILEYGMGIDSVSGNEVKYAIECGFPASSIVFAGVGKSDQEIRYSLSREIFAFNCEPQQELEVINSIASEMDIVANVALRINPDVDPMTHRHISTGQADNKFGISYKEIEELSDELAVMNNINITGLHFHIGSQITEMRVFEYLCKRVNTLYRWFTERGFRFSHINVGGGLGVDYATPDKNQVPDFQTYFGIFNDNLDIDHQVEIHFELGRSLVAQCGELISRILFTKTTAAGKNVAIADASMTELMRPALYQAEHAIENLEQDRENSIFTIAGTVCESTDTFARNIQIPELRRGDMISIKTAGAYGTSMASRYNLHDLPRSVYSDQLT